MVVSLELLTGKILGNIEIKNIHLENIYFF